MFYVAPNVFPADRWARGEVGASPSELVSLAAAYTAATLSDQVRETQTVGAVADADLQRALLAMRRLGTYGLYIYFGYFFSGGGGGQGTLVLSGSIGTPVPTSDWYGRGPYGSGPYG